MKLAILIINDLEDTGLEGLQDVLCKKYDFSYQTENSITYQPSIDEEEFLSFLGNGIESGYEDNELEYIHKFFSSPSFYYIEFYKFSLFKEIVDYLANYFEILVDDDRGNIYDKETLLKLEKWH